MPRDNEHMATLDTYKKLVIKEVVAVLKRDFDVVSPSYTSHYSIEYRDREKRDKHTNGATVDDLCNHLLKEFEVK